MKDEEKEEEEGVEEAEREELCRGAATRRATFFLLTRPRWQKYFVPGGTRQTIPRGRRDRRRQEEGRRERRKKEKEEELLIDQVPRGAKKICHDASVVESCCIRRDCSVYVAAEDENEE